MIKTVLIIWLIIINLTGFILPAYDKHCAEKGKWRIPEKTLFAVSLLGGSAAMYISMRLFRHKTLHKRFMIGIPVIIILQAAAVYLIYTRLNGEYTIIKSLSST